MPAFPSWRRCASSIPTARGRFRHHPRPRHRHARNAGAHTRVHSADRKIPMLTINLLQALPRTPLWDRLQCGRAARRRRDPRIQCRLPAALRRCRRGLETLRRRSLPARGALPALRLQRPPHLSQPAAAAGLAGARLLGQHRQGDAHPGERPRPRRRLRELPPHLLAPCRAALAAGPHRGRDSRRPRRASLHHLRRRRRHPQRLLLFASGGARPCTDRPCARGKTRMKATRTRIAAGRYDPKLGSASHGVRHGNLFKMVTIMTAARAAPTRGGLARLRKPRGENAR